MTITSFQRKILFWYRKNRRDFAWRRTFDPYKILVSEIMLQQTQISRVIPKYKEFLKTFPTFSSLARARTKKLLKVWQGLGYWRRALYLQKIARIIIKDYRGIFPRDPKILEGFPGIGRYTARAIACFVFQNPESFIDTNIRRVYLHFFFPKRKKVSDQEILRIAQKAIWKKNPREWHYALFDYGAVVLKDESVNKRSRHYHRQSKFSGSFRFFRTKVMGFLLNKQKSQSTKTALEKFLKKELQKFGKENCYAPAGIIRSLVLDGLIKKEKGPAKHLYKC